MTAIRSRKEDLKYKKYLKSKNKDECVFCPIKRGDDQLKEQLKFFKVIRNIFAYSVWDSQNVEDHLMIVPNEHTDSFSKMTNEQKIEYFDLLNKYEKLGYNIYLRAPNSTIKSIVHQHTHLIKTGGDLKRFVLFIRRPYLRLVRP